MLPRDPTSGYKIANLDDTGTPQYFGFVDKHGNWYILKLTDTDAKFVKGAGDYSAKWALRDTELGYDYFDQIF